MKHIRIALLIMVVSWVRTGPAVAYLNSQLKWKTIKTEHFEVHYHEGAEWTAQQVAHVAEEVHGPLTQLYDYEPQNPVHFVIRDTDDYANGAAYFYDNKVEIWATNLEFGFRGTTDWIRNVVTHEYTHIISIQASTKMPMRVPAIYFQGIGFENEKRSDVLNGYPNLIVSYPFSGVTMPPWFAEGVAQHQSPYKQYDCWDAHRDMILRAAVLEDKMLTYDEMSFFGKSSLRSEQVYDHGYGLVRFIADRYGDDAIADITRGLGSFFRLNIDGALKDATGKTGGQLYDEWKAHMRERYEQQVAAIGRAPVSGTELAPMNINEPVRTDRGYLPEEGQLIGVHACRRCGMQFRAAGDHRGFMTIAPTFSHSGGRVAFLSNAGSEYSATALYVMDPDGGNEKLIKGGVAARPRFSPDDRRVLYSRKTRVDRYGSTVSDIYEYDLADKKERRLTRAARASDPAYSPDGGHIVCVDNRDGSHRLVVMSADGENPRDIFVPESGTQLYNPQYSTDGRHILFGIFDAATRDIAKIGADGTGFEYVLRTANDERDARWARGGGSIVFASDRTGIFNIYELDLEDRTIDQLTDVVGGAFMPDLSPSGEQLVYARYSADGYAVFRVDRPRRSAVTMDELEYGRRAAGPFDDCEGLRAAAMAREATAGISHGEVASSDMTSSPGTTSAPVPATREVALSSNKYKSAYTPFQIFPRLVVYDNVPRLGVFLSSYEVLDKQSFFLGGSLGTNGEYDAFIRYEIRTLPPTLFADFFVVREKTDDAALDDDPASPTFRHRFEFDPIRYDLWQAEIGLKFELGPTMSLAKQNDLTLYWSHGEYRVNIEGKEFVEDGSFLASFDGGWKYYVGDQAHLHWDYRRLARAIDMDINPRGGRDIDFHYMRSFDDLFQNGEFLYGFRPDFTENHYNQYTLDWKEYVALPWGRHTLRLRATGSVIDESVSDFFWVYMGGQDGIRGYSYYSIGGRKGVIGSALYRFPIARNINKQFLHLYLRDLYGGVFYEAANAWNSGLKTTSFRKSLGYELRLSLGSYSVFPTAVSFVSAYSFDTVSFTEVFGALENVIRQDSGFSYYLNIGFGFDL